MVILQAILTPLVFFNLKLISAILFINSIADLTALFAELDIENSL